MTATAHNIAPLPRCPRCNSPETERGCVNADCGRWEGPEGFIARMEAEQDAWAIEEDRRFEQMRDERITARRGRHG